MGNAPGAGTVPAAPTSTEAPTILPAAVVATYSSMLEAVPESGGDGMAGILESLAAATDASDLDAPWRTEGLEAFLNTELSILRIRKVPSDYQGGLEWFLVADAAIVATGELVTFTTGAVSVVAQLVKAFALDAFPWRVIPRQSDRPSARGYFPQHLEVVAKQAAAKG